MWVSVKKFAEREEIKLSMIYIQACQDRKIGRSDRFRKRNGKLEVETERYFLTFRDPIIPELKRRIEQLYYEAIELTKGDYELAWIAHLNTDSPFSSVYGRFLRFNWRRGAKIVKKMCENLEAFITANEIERKQFLIEVRKELYEYDLRRKNKNKKHKNTLS